MAAVDFPASVFTDPSRAQRNLQTVHEMFLSSGSTYTLDQFSTALREHLTVSPDPDTALTNLLRFSEVAVSKASLFNDLLKYPVAMEVLLKLFGYSQYLGDILVRDPELFRWLTASNVLMERQTKSGLAGEVQRIEKMFNKPERRLDAFRRLYRREILRIGAKDVLGTSDLATITGELSDLADALIDASCRVAEVTLREKYGCIPATPYSVIGLGKLGGGELNYSSDIDIIFVYGDEGELPSRPAMTYHEYFNKFVEKLVQSLSTASGEGHIYRVDTRLRPESGMGSLARSAQSYLQYYESRGDLWERQMLIKARPVAGEIAFGEDFLRMLTPFIYPRTFFTHPAESIARIKARIEKAVAGDDNIKLQPGGIRDIEFVVQALQLLNGGKNERIRSQNTIQSIALLTAGKLLSTEEDSVLHDAYVFFRTLEHKLQTVMNTQTHSIPADRRERTTLARKMGFHSAEELLLQVDHHRRAVRKIFDAVLKVSPDETPQNGVEVLIDGGLGEEQMAKVLTDMGFSDPHRARRNLTAIATGSPVNRRKVLDGRSREVFREVAGDVFTSVSASASPDLTLNNLSMLVAGHSYPSQLFRALKEERFRKLVLTVCAISPRLARGLAKDELLLELLASDSATVSQPWDGKRPARMPLPLLKGHEELRAGIRYVLGMSSFRDYTTELSRLADEAVAAVFEENCKKHRLHRPPLALFAIGKYGTRELSLDADLDVFFVSEQKTKKATDELEKLASSVIQVLSRVGENGKLYDVDARLRPEGRNAPLVVDNEAYTAYLTQRSSLWERQSLTRMRFVCGDAVLGEKVAQAVTSFIYDTPLPPGWTGEIVAMRRKMETRSRIRSSEFFDVKLGPGGMVDVEFIAQMIQLALGGKDPAMRFLPTLDVLAMAPVEVVSHAQCAYFKKTYEFYRRVELMMRLVLEERSSTLPAGNKRDLLSRVFGFPRSEDLLDLVQDSMKTVRSYFLKIAGTLSSLE